MRARVERTIGTAEVLAILGGDDRIFRSGNAPQGTATPYITWFTIGDEPFDHLSGPPKTDRDTVQIDCYAGPGGSAERGVLDLAGAVRDALDAAGISNRLVVDLLEPDTMLYRIGLQADFIHDR